MEYALLGGALALSVAVAAGIARLLLGTLFVVMTRGRLPFVFHWRRVIFATALFWFWYLTPAVAESPTTTHFIRLLVSSH